MKSPAAVIISDLEGLTEVRGAHGAIGTLLWKRLAAGCDLYGEWEAVDYARLPVGSEIGYHKHTKTEEIYYVLAGHGKMRLDDETVEIGPGDLIVTPLGGSHGMSNDGPDDIEIVVVEVFPPEGTPAEVGKGFDVVNLKRSETADFNKRLVGPWRLIEIRTLQPGTSEAFDTDVAEHTLYVMSGTGTGEVGGERFSIEAGTALTFPQGSRASVTAGDERTLEVFAVALDVAH